MLLPSPPTHQTSTHAHLSLALTVVQMTTRAASTITDHATMLLIVNSPDW